MEGFLLQQNDADQHVLLGMVLTLAKSAYNAFFFGSIRFVPWKRIWKSWAPPLCKFFIWLAVKNCFLKGRPAHSKRLPTRLLAPSVIKRRPYSTYWFPVFSPGKSASSFCRLQKIGLASIALQPSTHRSSSWWYQEQAVKEVTMDYKRGFNSLAILVAWEIWKYRATVFLMGLLQALQRCCKLSPKSASFGAQLVQRASWSFLEGLWEGLRQ
jgi:hypothetical protein